MEQGEKYILIFYTLACLMRSMKYILFVFLSLIFSVQLQAQQGNFATTDFKKADSVAALYGGHSLKDIRSLAIKLTYSFSAEEEKFRALYTWTCTNIAYDYELYMKDKKKEKIRDRDELKAWNKKFNARVFKHLLNKKKTVCSGYAYLLRELALHAGITCVIVDGYGRTSDANVRGQGKPNHSWNAVKLKDKWYLCDPTWSSGGINMQALKFVKDYDDVYFLTDPSLFVRNHYPLDSAWMLLRDKPSLHAFINGPLIYKAALRYKITPSLQLTMDIQVEKGKPVSFWFTAADCSLIEKMTMYSESPNRTVTFHPPLYQQNDGVYCSDVIFNSKGKYLVHVLVNNGYAYTYSVKVK